jgi:hypothetical protein
MKKEKFEPELARHLGPVNAPDQLWDRVHGAASAGRSVRTTPTAWNPAWAWVSAVALVAIAAGLTVWLNRDPNRGMTSEQIAVRALSRTPDQLQFRSADLTELRTWVKSGTGLDVPLPVRTASSVQMVGAYVSRKGTTTAEISYRVGGVGVALVVSKIPLEGDGRHEFVKAGSYHDANFQSWTMRGQMYTIASADAKMGCLLCHSTGAPRPSFN